MLQTGISLFRVKSEEFQSSLSVVRTMCHPVRTSICLLFHPSGRRVFPSGHLHHIEKLLCQLAPSGRFSSTPGRLSVLERFTDSFQVQEREDQSIFRTMWYPVRTLISVRQESQFKMNRPDIWQLWSGRWCIVYGNWGFDFNRPEVSPLWSGRTRIRYGNCVLKFSRPDAPTPWSGRAKPVMSHPVRTMFLYRKDFSTKISENLVAQLSVRTVMVHRPYGSQAYFSWRPFWSPAYK